MFLIAVVTCALVCISAAYVHSQRFSPTHIVSECSHAQPNFKALCYTNHINDVLEHRGLKSALDLVAAGYVSDPAFLSFCHSNMHDLGEAAYKQFDSTEKIDLTGAASYCGYGFYHGFIVAMMDSTGSLKQAVDFCTYVGNILGGEQQYADGACYHGIGHGITDGTDVTAWGDLSKITAPGLAICRQIAHTDEFDMRCASGVFNSIAIMYPQPQYKLDVQGDPYVLCRTPSYNANEKKACYGQMNTLVSFISKYNPVRMLSYAEAVTNSAYRHLAVQNVSALFYSNHASISHHITAANCDVMHADDWVPCMNGLIDGAMEYGSPGKEYELPISFCSTAELTSAQEQSCFDEISRYADGIYSEAQQKVICANIPIAFTTSQCRRLSDS